MSIQGVFDEFVKKSLVPGLRSMPESEGAKPGDTLSDANWRDLFLKALPAAAAIKRASDLTLVWVNEGYSTMAGESREALVGKTVGQIWAARDSASLIESHDRAALEKRDATVEIEDVKDRWGKPLRRLRIRFPIPGKSGEIEFLGAIGFDYTEIVNRIPGSTDEPG